MPPTPPSGSRGQERRHQVLAGPRGHLTARRPGAAGLLLVSGLSLTGWRVSGSQGGGPCPQDISHEVSCPK